MHSTVVLVLALLLLSLVSMGESNGYHEYCDDNKLTQELFDEFNDYVDPLFNEIIIDGDEMNCPINGVDGIITLNLGDRMDVKLKIMNTGLSAPPNSNLDFETATHGKGSVGELHIENNPSMENTEEFRTFIAELTGLTRLRLGNLNTGFDINDAFITGIDLLDLTYIKFNDITVSVTSLSALTSLKIVSLLSTSTTIADGMFPSDIESITLQQIKINPITNDLFSGYTNLKILYVELCEVATIYESAFPVFLEVLSLIGNDMDTDTINRNIFGSLDNLRYLYLNNNGLARLPSDPDDVQLPSNLKKLYLDANQFTIGYFTDLGLNLDALYLGFNDLTALGDTNPFGDGIEVINLRSNKITELPDWILNLNLNLLEISGNQLYKLPLDNTAIESYEPSDSISGNHISGCSTDYTNFAFTCACNDDENRILSEDNFIICCPSNNCEGYTCDPGRYRGTISECSECEQGTYSLGGDATQCTPHSTLECAKGYKSSDPSTTQDTVCTECDYGTYTQDDGQNACELWTVCYHGTYVFVEGTTSTDRVCRACHPGTTTYFRNANKCSTIPSSRALGTDDVVALSLGILASACILGHLGFLYWRGNI